MRGMATYGCLSVRGAAQDSLTPVGTFHQTLVGCWPDFFLSDPSSQVVQLA